MAYYAFANLKEQDLSAIKALESKLGHTLVAMKPVDLKPATLDDTDVAAVKDLEHRLGIALIAINP